MTLVLSCIKHNKLYNKYKKKKKIVKPLGYGCIDEATSCSWLMTHEEGWNKVLQCIRVKKDKGVVIYDDRYHVLMIKYSYLWRKFSLLISKDFSFFTRSSLELIRDSKNYSSHLTSHVLLFPRMEICSPYLALNVCVSIYTHTITISQHANFSFS